MRPPPRPKTPTFLFLALREGQGDGKKARQQRVSRVEQLQACKFSIGAPSGAGQGCPQSMGAAESAEAAAQGGLTTEILKLKAAKANGWLSDDEFDAEVHPPPLFGARGLAANPRARTERARLLRTSFPLRLVLQVKKLIQEYNGEMREPAYAFDEVMRVSVWRPRGSPEASTERQHARGGVVT